MSKQSLTTASIKQSMRQAPLFKTTHIEVDNGYEQVEGDEDYFE